LNNENIIISYIYTHIIISYIYTIQNTGFSTQANGYARPATLKYIINPLARY